MYTWPLLPWPSSFSRRRTTLRSGSSKETTSKLGSVFDFRKDCRWEEDDDDDEEDDDDCEVEEVEEEEEEVEAEEEEAEDEEVVEVDDEVDDDELADERIGLGSGNEAFDFLLPVKKNTRPDAIVVRTSTGGISYSYFFFIFPTRAGQFCFFSLFFFNFFFIDSSSITQLLIIFDLTHKKI
ncbi:MAG: hypothetical protein K2Z81_20515 [Cyanobacteria bacterium]|nr:hypothetical protein [Cyanobacteriota bacterium]